VHLWIRSFDSVDARPLPGVELLNLPVPFLWSFDSRFIAFLSADHKLKKVDVAGGPSPPAAPQDAAWAHGTDGRDGAEVRGSAIRRRVPTDAAARRSSTSFAADAASRAQS
jgi:hypothetical protein